MWQLQPVFPGDTDYDSNVDVETLLSQESNMHLIPYDSTCYSYTNQIILLTYSMEQSPSWEANQFVASQEIPRVLCNQKVHYRIRKCPPPVLILSQPNPVHTPTSHTLKVHPNIILHLRLGLPGGLFPSCFPTKSLYMPLSSHPRYMPRPYHSSRFYHTPNLGWGVQIMKLLIMKFPPLASYLVSLRPKYYLLRNIQTKWNDIHNKRF
jgi:hypothetical protein